MPNNIDQPHVPLRLPQKIPTLPRPLHLTPPRRLTHTSRPFGPNAKGLLYPRSETDLLHHGRSRNFLAREAAPRHRVHRVSAFTALVGPRRITGVVAYFAFYVQEIEVWSQGGGEGRSRDEELDKSFLKDETARRTPAMDGVNRGQTVDSRLGRDGPIALPQGQLGELGRDKRGLG